ncbi:hypothetical protein [Tenacibaculum sp. 47A_GOM-205m]|uniref:hypothetical protein n=1 Tax=Tenacibaculum sp. 47A_GOM-205m TaxID=1380384 RepID=UPI00048DD41E|nr:hypothetical protein [Tenacibaculum sp. 47A_GOM-205m]
MRKFLLLLVLSIFSIVYTQDSKNENTSIIFKEIKGDTSFVLSSFKFKVQWDSKLSYSKNIGYYGGIKKLIIYNSNKTINSFLNIEDVTGLNEIVFRFYDYNSDGYLDFAIPLASGKSTWLKYYLYDAEKLKFYHNKEWDYK